MTLQYRADTGALLYIAQTDALMAECCCTPVDCNIDCDPPLLEQYTVTLAGLGGCFAVRNGVYTVTYFRDCDWHFIYMAGGFEQWRITLRFGAPWQVSVRMGFGPFGGGNIVMWDIRDLGASWCDPVALYPLVKTCWWQPPELCQTTCADSSGATALVSAP